MQPPFYKLPSEQRSKILDTIYTATLAINLLFLQNLLDASPEHFTDVALINFAVGIPASAGAVLSKRIHQRSTPLDRFMGMIALINTTVGVAAALWRFSLQISITFVICTFLAAILVLVGHNVYPIPSPEPPDQQPNREQRRKKQH